MNLTEGGMGGMVKVMTNRAVSENTEVNGMQMTDESVSFYLWDESVPALPIIAQLLLAAVMAIGGYRRYRRR